MPCLQIGWLESNGLVGINDAVCIPPHLRLLQPLDLERLLVRGINFCHLSLASDGLIGVPLPSICVGQAPPAPLVPRVDDSGLSLPVDSTG